jgi:hypothetical protein
MIEHGKELPVSEDRDFFGRIVWAIVEHAKDEVRPERPSN